MNDDEPLALSNRDARRLAVRGALLSGDRLPSDRDGIMAVVRGLGHLQIDPTRTVEKTHLLVLWSRLGAYATDDLDRLLAERQLFEYNAFIFPRESLPERKFVMAGYARQSGAWLQRVREWVVANEPFRRHLLDRLADEGALPSRAFKDATYVPWPSSGWTSGRNVSQMFAFLHSRGELMIAGRKGPERLWDLPERVLPEFAATPALTEEEYIRTRVEILLRRFGIVSRRDLPPRVWFVPRRAVLEAIDEAVEDGDLVPVTAEGVRSPAYTTPAALEALDAPDEPRTTLLSPFDPLVNDRQRTEGLFGFHYRLEMYVPKTERRYGHFVLPILHDDRLIGRIDPRMDRRTGTFTVRVFTEPDAPMTIAAGDVVGRTIRDLASWLGATEVAVDDDVPVAWRNGLLQPAAV